MNRRQFLGLLSLGSLIAACSKRISQVSGRQSTTGSADYLRELSKQVYPKVKDSRIPLDYEVLRFNPTLGQFERTVTKRVFLRPSLRPDGILAWSPED